MLCVAIASQSPRSGHVKVLRFARAWDGSRVIPDATIVVKGSRGADDEESVRRYGARMAEVAARLEAAGGRA